MEETFENIPDDCWESIVSRLDHHHREPLSLVCKGFLSLTNRLRLNLKVINPSRDVLSRQLRRFRGLKKIDLSNSRGQLDEALRGIAQSQLDLRELNISGNDYPPIALLKQVGYKMKNIKVLHCSHSYLTDSDLISIAECFTSVEELDVSKQYEQTITDYGIVALSMKLKGLRKINLTGNRKITDHSIISLSQNCRLLKKVVLCHCPGVSRTGISFLMENSPQYDSLILACANTNARSLTPPFIKSKHISTIDLNQVKISNNLLCKIANANLPLRTFRLSFCTDFTLDGLTSLLKAYPSLESLALNGTNFLTDECIKSLSKYMSKLNSIHFNSCFKLTISAFITVAVACPMINHIEIITSSSDHKQNFEKELLSAINPALISISLTCTSTILERLLPVCPKLQVLNLTTLVHTHELDIQYILKQCRHLRHLTINHCQNLTFSGKRGHESPYKLETLAAKKSRVNDQLLEMVGKRCPNLLNLNLQSCMSVTQTGVSELVRNCKQLRYVNLNWSMKVDKDFVAWLVASQSSLRQIVIPYPLDEDQASTSVIQGCAVYAGTWEEWCV